MASPQPPPDGNRGRGRPPKPPKPARNTGGTTSNRPQDRVLLPAPAAQTRRETYIPPPAIPTAPRQVRAQEEIPIDPALQEERSTSEHGLSVPETPADQVAQDRGAAADISGSTGISEGSFPKPVTRGGSTVRGTKNKRNKPLEETYPMMFRPLTRNGLKESEDTASMVYYPFQSMPNPPNDEQQTILKNKIDFLTRQVFFTFTSNRLCGTVVKTAAPNVDTRDVVFGALLKYSRTVFQTIKHDFLYNYVYQQALVWLADFGKTNFRYDPDIWGEGESKTIPEAHLIHTKNWLYDHLDRAVFTSCFKSVAAIIDWDATFGNREKRAFYYLKIMFGTVVMKVTAVVLAERKLNPGIAWRPKLPGWRTASKERDSCRDVFDVLGWYHEFRKVEIKTFVWIEPSAGEPVPEVDRPPPANVLRGNIISNSPAPSDSDDSDSSDHDAPRSKTKSAPPRHRNLSRHAFTTEEGDIESPFGASDLSFGVQHSPFGASEQSFGGQPSPSDAFGQPEAQRPQDPFTGRGGPPPYQPYQPRQAWNQPANLQPHLPYLPRNPRNPAQPARPAQPAQPAQPAEPAQREKVLVGGSLVDKEYVDFVLDLRHNRAWEATLPIEERELVIARRTRRLERAHGEKDTPEPPPRPADLDDSVDELTRNRAWEATLTTPERELAIARRIRRNARPVGAKDTPAPPPRPRPEDDDDELYRDVDAPESVVDAHESIVGARRDPSLISDIYSATPAPQRRPPPPPRHTTPYLGLDRAPKPSAPGGVPGPSQQLDAPSSKKTKSHITVKGDLVTVDGTTTTSGLSSVPSHAFSGFGAPPPNLPGPAPEAPMIMGADAGSYAQDEPHSSQHRPGSKSPTELAFHLASDSARASREPSGPPPSQSSFQTFQTYSYPPPPAVPGQESGDLMPLHQMGMPGGHQSSLPPFKMPQPRASRAQPTDSDTDMEGHRPRTPAQTESSLLKRLTQPTASTARRASMTADTLSRLNTRSRANLQQHTSAPDTDDDVQDAPPTSGKRKAAQKSKSSAPVPTTRGRGGSRGGRGGSRGGRGGGGADSGAVETPEAARSMSADTAQTLDFLTPMSSFPARIDASASCTIADDEHGGLASPLESGSSSDFDSPLRRHAERLNRYRAGYE